jgi:hypothetical protein
MGLPLLNNLQLDIALREDGYVIIPLLDTEAIESLLSFYYETNKTVFEGMSASAHAPDISYRKEVDTKINEIITPFVFQQVQNLRLLGSSFISKSKGENGSLAPHQDWNLTDELQFRSFNLWVPLVDTDEKNGGIMLLPGSHKIIPNYRGPGIPSIVEPILNEVWSQMIHVNIPAGHALLYDHRLIHASKANTTDHQRVVTVSGMIETNAPMYIYYGHQNNISYYKITPVYFLENNPNEGPQNIELVKSFEYNLTVPSVENAINSFKVAGIQINSDKSKQKISFFRWIQQLINKFRYGTQRNCIRG